MEKKLAEQKKIAAQLKGMVGVLAAAGALFVVYLSRHAYLLYREAPERPAWVFILFTWGMFIMSLLALRLFYGVCTRIGEDRSFSEENAVAFRGIAHCGLGVSAFATGQLLTYLLFTSSGAVTETGVMRGIVPGYLLWELFEIFAGIAVFVVCRALSRLIHNAYELQQENDLTI